MAVTSVFPVYVCCASVVTVDDGLTPVSVFVVVAVWFVSFCSSDSVTLSALSMLFSVVEVSVDTSFAAMVSSCVSAIVGVSLSVVCADSDDMPVVAPTRVVSGTCFGEVFVSVLGFVETPLGSMFVVVTSTVPSVCSLAPWASVLGFVETSSVSVFGVAASTVVFVPSVATWVCSVAGGVASFPASPLSSAAFVAVSFPFSTVLVTFGSGLVLAVVGAFVCSVSSPAAL